MKQNSQHRIETVVVLGAGVMGSQIAAHCVNAGLEVTLLDLKSDDPDQPDKIAQEAVKKLISQNPEPLGDQALVKQISTGNFDDDLQIVSNCDWVCEAIIERMDIKRSMMKKLEAAVGSHTVISTNTSGLRISEIVKECSADYRRRFLGVHFFNPPRYMKLVELIPATDTDPEIVEQMRGFCERTLGKGVVECKDTPNFIGNRLGVFSMASIMPWYFDGRFRAEEIDELTGTLTGYSKAGTFRTCDMVGLDVLAHVADNLYPDIPDDERRDLFKLPEAFLAMVNKGWLGNKAGQGFYKRVKTADGSAYHVLNPQTMSYEAQEDVSFESVKLAQKDGASAGERLKALVNSSDKAGEFLWSIQCDLLLYSANRIPEISDSIESLDRAMRWGYNWELGPFQRWDAMGVRETVERMEKEGRTVPDNVKKMLDSGRESFYEGETVYNLSSAAVEPLQSPARGAVTARILGKAGGTVWKNDHAALYDMGEGVALFEFRTVHNTLGFGLIENVEKACQSVVRDFDALVIGHDGDDFSYGANLKEVLLALQKGQTDRVRQGIENFQATARGLRYQPFPVVAAVSGRTFGGGCEFMMHCDHVVSHFELYTGLVEMGVGIIPAGGGTKELLLRALEKSHGLGEDVEMKAVRDAFKTIAMSHVSKSALNARELGFLHKSDSVTMNRDLLLRDAKLAARYLADMGYRPPAVPELKLLGRTAYSALKLSIFIMRESGYISEYDQLLAEHVAHVLTGGDLSEPVSVPESVVLQLEREAILSLLENQKTLDRMEHMLKTGKPLRN